MKITEMRVRAVAPPEFTFQWREDIPPIQNTLTVFELVTDSGVIGESTAWVPASPSEIGEAAAHFFRPLVVGSSVYARERLWHEMMAFARYMIMPKAASCIDIALWDIAAKVADLPLYEYLGAYRETVPAYATTETQDTVADYVNLALECKERGLHAVKIHAAAKPDEDIEVCEAVREAVGPGYTLMLDATSAYDYQDALRVGRRIEQLGFHWYEDPVRDDDLAGLADLCQALDIPILMGESFNRGPWPYAHVLAMRAADALRAVGDVMGGITGLRKVGALAEAHNRRMEPHSYGSTLIQAAHLHHMLSARNCEFFELPVPRETLDFGMKDVVEIDDDGMVVTPTRPGLGYRIDWDAMDNATVAEF